MTNLSTAYRTIIIKHALVSFSDGLSPLVDARLPNSVLFPQNPLEWWRETPLTGAVTGSCLAKQASRKRGEQQTTAA